MGRFFERYRVVGYGLMTLCHVLLRSAGIGFVAMMFFISVFDEVGTARINWPNALAIATAVLLGFLGSNVVLREGRSVGLRHPLRYASCPLGVLVSALLFLSPMRP